MFGMSIAGASVSIEASGIIPFCVTHLDRWVHTWGTGSYCLSSWMSDCNRISILKDSSTSTVECGSLNETQRLPCHHSASWLFGGNAHTPCLNNCIQSVEIRTNINFRKAFIPPTTPPPSLQKCTFWFKTSVQRAFLLPMLFCKCASESDWGQPGWHSSKTEMWTKAGNRLLR